MAIAPFSLKSFWSPKVRLSRGESGGEESHPGTQKGQLRIAIWSTPKRRDTPRIGVLKGLLCFVITLLTALFGQKSLKFLDRRNRSSRQRCSCSDHCRWGTFDPLIGTIGRIPKVYKEKMSTLGQNDQG